MQQYETRAYACYNKDAAIRFQSTSGGLFYSVASYVIEELHGVVFGATFDDEYSVCHQMIVTVTELGSLCGSKYPQSDLKNTFIEIRKKLLNGTTVLFVGTPCQIGGLLAYLGNKPDNLLCLDFVCHGVASPSVWNGYLDLFTQRQKINIIRFKDKSRGWKHWYTKIEYCDGGGIYQRGSLNPFMRSYLDCVNMRPSCFHCKFKGLKRSSDFTVADCWGVGEQNKHLNDDRGLSALLVHTEKAQEIFKIISSQIVYEVYSPEILMAGNMATFISSIPGTQRSAFYQTCQNETHGEALRKFYMPSLKSYISYYIKRFLGKEK